MADQKNNPWDTTPAADSAAQSDARVHWRLHRPTAVALTG